MRNQLLTLFSFGYSFSLLINKIAKVSKKAVETLDAADHHCIKLQQNVSFGKKTKY